MKRTLFLLLVIVGGCRQTPAIVFPEGGYPYPDKISAGDSTYFYYPVKDHFSRGDSLWYAFSYSFYGDYGEPNISLQPLPKPVFRFVYSPALDIPILFVLNENEIVVKKCTSGCEMKDGENLLAPPEKARYLLLKRQYPLYSKAYGKGLKKYIDSMVNDFPRLTDPAYFKYLIEKIMPVDRKSFVYSTRRIPLTAAQYKHLVSAINGSGYWKLPLEASCKPVSMDGFGYLLEANTPDKYNLAVFNGDPCPSYHLLKKACQELVNYAGEKKVFTEN